MNYSNLEPNQRLSVLALLLAAWAEVTESSIDESVQGAVEEVNKHFKSDFTFEEGNKLFEDEQGMLQTLGFMLGQESSNGLQRYEIFAQGIVSEHTVWMKHQP